MIALALAFLFVRDPIVLPKTTDQLSAPPLIAVTALHFRLQAEWMRQQSEDDAAGGVGDQPQAE